MLVPKSTYATFLSGINLYWCPCCKKASQWADPAVSSTTVSWSTTGTATFTFDED